MKKYFKSIIIAGVLLFGTNACIHDLNVESIDPNRISQASLDGLFLKIYGTLGLTGQQGPAGQGDIAGIDEGNSSFFRMIYTMNEFPADMIFWVWPDVGVEDIRTARWNPANPLIRGLYSRLYFNITLCNLFLDETVGETSPDMLARRAEVRFIRALNYFYLLDMFGNVPFTITISRENPYQIQRADLYAWLVDELKDLYTDLAPAGNRISYYRVDQAAAWLLLSRVFLNAEVYTGTPDWENAALYAKKVIDSPYQLASEYRFLFMGDNNELSGVNDAYREIILPIAQHGQFARSWGGSKFLIAATHTGEMADWGITASWQCIRARRELVELFFPLMSSYDDIANATVKGETADIIAAAGDDRAMFTNFRRRYNEETGEMDTVMISLMGRRFPQGSTSPTQAPFFEGWAITKFTNHFADPNRSPSDPVWPDMDIPFMRKAEAYLNYAEAVFRGAPASGMSALDAINTVRRRANASDLTSLSLDEILRERGREFFSEGYRRSDLIRFNRFGGNTGYFWEWKGGAILGRHFEEFRNLYPIPMSDMIANPNLTQNPGY